MDIFLLVIYYLLILFDIFMHMQSQFINVFLILLIALKLIIKFLRTRSWTSFLEALKAERKLSGYNAFVLMLLSGPLSLPQYTDEIQLSLNAFIVLLILFYYTYDAVLSYYQEFKRDPKSKRFLVLSSLYVLLLSAVMLVVKVSYDVKLDIFNFTPYLIGAVIITPIAEEYVFRKALYKKLSVSFNDTVSVLMITVLFALIHIPNLVALPIYLLSSFAYSYVYVKKGKYLIQPIILHALYNYTIVMLAFFTP